MRMDPRPRSERRASLCRAFSVACAAGLFLTVVGCEGMEGEQAKADKKVRAAATQAVALRRQPTVKNVDAVVKDLNAVIKTAGASETRQIQAKSLLAQTEFELGDKVTGQLLPLEVQIASDLWEIGRMADRINSINLQVEALNKAEPAAVLKAIADKRAEVTAAGDAAAKKAADLQGQINTIQGKLNELAQQQAELRKQADADRAKAAGLSGKEQADVLDRVTEAMRKAENIGHEIFKISGALTPPPESSTDKPWEDPKNKALIPLHRDMAVENEKKANADKVVAELAAAEKAANDAWAATQKEIADRKQAAAQVGQDMAKAAQGLAKVEADAAALRATAMDHYKNAEKQWQASAGDAIKLGKRLQEWSRDEKYAKSPEKYAWQMLADTYSNNYFKLLQGRALDRQGTRLAAEARLAEAKVQLTKDITAPLQGAGVTPPTLAAAVGDPKGAAGKAFDEAIKLYTDIAQLNQDAITQTRLLPSLKNGAQLSAAFASYAEYCMTKDEAKRKLAEDQLTPVFSSERIKEDPRLNALYDMLPPDLKVKKGAAAPADQG